MRVLRLLLCPSLSPAPTAFAPAQVLVLDEADRILDMVRPACLPLEPPEGSSSRVARRLQPSAPAPLQCAAKHLSTRPPAVSAFHIACCCTAGLLRHAQRHRGQPAAPAPDAALLGHAGQERQGPGAPQPQGEWWHSISISISISISSSSSSSSSSTCAAAGIVGLFGKVGCQGRGAPQPQGKRRLQGGDGASRGARWMGARELAPRSSSLPVPLALSSPHPSSPHHALSPGPRARVGANASALMPPPL